MFSGNGQAFNLINWMMEKFVIPSWRRLLGTVRPTSINNWNGRESQSSEVKMETWNFVTSSLSSTLRENMRTFYARQSHHSRWTTNEPENGDGLSTADNVRARHQSSNARKRKKMGNIQYSLMTLETLAPGVYYPYVFGNHKSSSLAHFATTLVRCHRHIAMGSSEP